MTVKLLTELHSESLSLKGGCTGSSESTLVKTPHCKKKKCWKSHDMAHLMIHQSAIMYNPKFSRDTWPRCCKTFFMLILVDILTFAGIGIIITTSEILKARSLYFLVF